MLNRNKVVAALATSMLMVCAGSAIAAPPVKKGTNVPMVQDWSTNLVGFRNPMTPEEAKAKGPAQYARWQRLASDPRYMLSLQRKLEAQAAAADARLAAANRPGTPAPPPPTTTEAPNSMHRDWKVALGGYDTSGAPAGVGQAGDYPAKFNFNINAAPSCANDFVVWGTTTLGATASGSLSTRASTTYANASTSLSITLSVGGRAITLSGATGNPNSGLTFTTTTTGSTNADNLRDAINRWTGTTGLTASSASGVVTLTANSARATINASSTSTTTLDWTNQAALAGTAGMPSIIAYNQLYNGACTATRTNSSDKATNPDLYWAYNTGGKVQTSPVLSYWDNGQQVAFIQSTSANQAELVLLKWKAGSGTAGQPATPALAATASDYRNGTGLCAGGVSCMFKITFSGAAGDDTGSSPFVDYFNDVLYVGDDNGNMHKFTGVFAFTPAEVTTGGFPAANPEGTALNSPVYDFNGSIFVGGAAINGSKGGKLHKINASTGAFTSSARLVANGQPGAGARSVPLLDVSAGKIFAFIYKGTVATCGGNTCRMIYQFDTGAGFPGTPVTTTIGAGNATGNTNIQFHGAFDSAWYNSADSTGSIYVCGATPTALGDMTMWRVNLAAGVMSTTSTQGPQIASGSAAANCSPVTLVKNGSSEYVFVTPIDSGIDATTGLCSGNCIYMFNTANLNPERWAYTFADVTAATGSFTVNSVVFTPANGSSNCTSAGGTFDYSGTASADAASLAACIAKVPGYAAAVTSTQVIVRTTTSGNQTDTVVSTTGLGYTAGTHIDGAVGTSWLTTSAPAAGLAIPSTAGSGGIVVDNLSATPGSSQIYFTTRQASANLPGVGVQASQAGLQ